MALYVFFVLCTFVEIKRNVDISNKQDTRNKALIRREGFGDEMYSHGHFL